MHQERDTVRRGRILDFPHQLGQLGEQLCLFVELAFAGNRYQRASQLRGVYLTSAPQLEGGLDPVTLGCGCTGCHRRQARRHTRGGGAWFPIGGCRAGYRPQGHGAPFRAPASPAGR